MPVRLKGHSKYHAQPERIDGIRFASRAEARRYCELKLLERDGQVEGLELQPEFPLLVIDQQGMTPTKIGTYRADFRYRTFEGTSVVEDVKGFKTALYTWKKKHVEAQYGIEIREIGSR